MQITPDQAKYISGSFELVKVPEIGGIPAQRLPEVIDTVWLPPEVFTFRIAVNSGPIAVAWMEFGVAVPVMPPAT